MKPFVKFLNGAASYTVFIVLLIFHGAIQRDGIRERHNPTGLDIVVFVWLIGFCFGEVKQLYKNGVKDYFSSGWNWVDVGMNFFMLFTYVTWIVMYVLMREGEVPRGRPGKTPERFAISAKTRDTVLQFADGSFCAAVILSFFRLLYLCQATSSLGLIQICLGKMMFVIMQFMFVAVIVLLAFTVTMAYLFNASPKVREREAEEYFKKKYKDNPYYEDSTIYQIFAEDFAGFASALFTLIYVSLGVEDTSTLENFEDGTLLHLWANVLFIAYVGISMLIFLNILIAMMNSSYQVIADNITTEHLFVQTKLWLDYLGDEQTLPIPFNIIPRVHYVCTFIQWLSGCTSCHNGDEVSVLVNAEEKRYRKICESLVKRYLRKQFGCMHLSDPLCADVDELRNDPLVEKIEIFYEQCKSLKGGFGEELSYADDDDDDRVVSTQNKGYGDSTVSILTSVI